LFGVHGGGIWRICVHLGDARRAVVCRFDA
jgi:hypothetical protein